MDRVFQALARTRAGGCCSEPIAMRTMGDAGAAVRAPGHEIARRAKHLKLLEEANLVATIWRGAKSCINLNPVPIHEIAERWIGKFEHGRLRMLAELKRQLEGETDG